MRQLRKVITILGLSALSSFMLSGCSTIRPQIGTTSNEEYKERWDALETTYGAPNDSFRLLYADLLNAWVYETTEVEKLKLQLENK